WTASPRRLHGCVGRCLPHSFANPVLDLPAGKRLVESPGDLIADLVDDGLLPAKSSVLDPLGNLLPDPLHLLLGEGQVQLVLLPFRLLHGFTFRTRKRCPSKAPCRLS